MNKARRKRLEKAIALIEEASEIISAVKDEQEEALDNLPASIRDGDRGETMQAEIDGLDDVLSMMEDGIEKCREV